METTAFDRSSRARLLVAAAGMALAGLAASGEALAMGAAAVRPPAAEFGTGPRPSSHGLYAASLEPREPLALRQMQTVAVRLLDAQGRPVENATISIQGGMPEHMHGLPTQPRVTRTKDDGVYEIEGLRFSMGGWWELRLSIESPAGADSVTFNLGL